MLNNEEKRNLQEIIKIELLLKEGKLGKVNIYKNRNFCVVGKVGMRRKPCSEEFSKAVDLMCYGDKEWVATVNFRKVQDLEILEHGELVKISKLKIFPKAEKGSIKLYLCDSSYTEIKKAIPSYLADVSCKRKGLNSVQFLSTQKSRMTHDYCTEYIGNIESIVKVLIVNLSKIAYNTQEGPKFSLRYLLNLSEKVSFVGILLVKEEKASDWNSTFYMKLRDLLTNDSINAFVAFSYSNQSQKSFLDQISAYDVLHITGNRMVISTQISQNLGIYIKLTLNQDFSNIRIESKHDECQNTLCPCKVSINSRRFTPNFAPFFFISDIKPTILFRAHMRLYVKVDFVNSLIFKQHCGSCHLSNCKNDSCCANRRLEIKVILGGVIDDSSGVADCEINYMENIREILALTGEVEQEILELGRGRGEAFVKYADFPDSFKRHIKNLGPVNKFCLAKPEIKQRSKKHLGFYKDFMNGTDTEELVMLNANRACANAFLKVLKVF